GNACAALFSPLTGPAGNYTYTITGVAPCINDIALVNVQTSEAGDAGVGASVSLCSDGDEIDLFTQLGGTPDANGVWTAPDGSVIIGFFDPAIDPQGAYTYTVTPILPCPQVSAVMDLSVVFPVVTAFTVVSNGTCAPLEVTFSHDYTGAGTCTWILGNGDTIHDCSPITGTYTDPGSYDVTLIIDAGNQCGADTVTVEDAVVVYAQPAAAFDVLPPSINTLQPVAFFNNTSAGAHAYEWTIDGDSVSYEEDLRYGFTPELGAEYEVCLIAFAAAVCTDTLCTVVNVDDGLGVFVPNTFTPNHDDKNETFKPIVTGIDPRYYQFMIFDRWGNMFFSTKDPAAFWDGLHDGEDAPQDVYVWKLIAKDALSGARIERVGHVSLLR
ncbi:MAG TPA: gliding motility-associated C-terminal domain-containing protein, partial [Flavobacteriales bacterium]|nr:gliding motility-associated C-terminal domain-containing protein [Flavobacteriales bacterium]